MEVRHKFVSNKRDGSDHSVIKPSDWNKEHAIVMNGNSLIGRADATKGEATEIELGRNLKIQNKTLQVTADIDFDAMVANSLFQG
jgi:hypothetical protein